MSWIQSDLWTKSIDPMDSIHKFDMAPIRNFDLSQWLVQIMFFQLPKFILLM